MELLHPVELADVPGSGVGEERPQLAHNRPPAKLTLSCNRFAVAILQAEAIFTNSSRT
jgi:hypothetical protein